MSPTTRGPHTGPAPRRELSPERKNRNRPGQREPHLPHGRRQDRHGLAPELFRRALKGKQDDWETLVRRHHAYLYRVARSFRLDEATCEDAVQTTRPRLLAHAGELREPDRVERPAGTRCAYILLGPPQPRWRVCLPLG